jgi:hypothetical protein
VSNRQSIAGNDQPRQTIRLDPSTESFDPFADGGLGFQLVRALANGLDAEPHLENNSLGIWAWLVKPTHLVS